LRSSAQCAAAPTAFQRFPASAAQQPRPARPV
jgi:hypothetical protein